MQDFRKVRAWQSSRELTAADVRRERTRCVFQIAFGSSVELLHHLIICLDLGFLSADEYQELDAKLEATRRMIAAFMRRLRTAQ